MTKLFLISYALVLILLTFFSYFFIDINFPYFQTFTAGFNWRNTSLTSLVYGILILISFLIYAFFLKKYKDISSRKIKQIILVSFIPLFSYPAMLSYDIFNYIATAKVLFNYHENPYLIMPMEFLKDPILLFTQAANKIALYGPLWTLISGIPYALSFSNYLVSIFAFKVLVLLFYIGMIWIIWKITRNYYSILLFAANPLVVIEVFISGHNDILMMLLVLLSFYFLRNKKIYLSIVLILASILIKYSTIFLIPVFIYVVIKNINGSKLDWDKIYFYCFISMILVFSLSIFREEIYPWYAIWPFSFLVLTRDNKIIKSGFIFLTFGLMLSYIPYMYSGNYFGLSHAFRILSIFLPLILFSIYLILKNKIKTLNL